MTNRTEVHHRMPAQRQAPVQHAAHDMRAYRLGRCELLAKFGGLLADHDCTLPALRREIEADLASLAPARAASPGEQQRHRGGADACRACLAFLAANQSSRATLAVHIVCLLITAWPKDYREYRHRCKTWSGEDPALPDPATCLELHEWYDTVDALHAEIDRTQRLGLPPSQAQRALAAMLLRNPGEPAPCAE